MIYDRRASNTTAARQKMSLKREIQHAHDNNTRQTASLSLQYNSQPRVTHREQYVHVHVPERMTALRQIHFKQRYGCFTCICTATNYLPATSDFATNLHNVLRICFRIKR